ncbi:MAG TPA: PepSY-like domain-containing protein [Puia sp.]|nr:PepSY-like domain-containing protein [Puia sp.]
MKAFLVIPMLIAVAYTQDTYAQDIKTKDVPQPVRHALLQKYPQATRVTWEKENGNFEANWGGRSGEDHSVQFSPAGSFVEEVDAMPVKDLPASIAGYVKTHYHTPIREAGKRIDATGRHTLEVEIKGKDLLFTPEGKFLQ